MADSQGGLKLATTAASGQRLGMRDGSSQVGVMMEEMSDLVSGAVAFERPGRIHFS